MEFSEVERSIEFLLAQQAQFMTDLQHSRELSDQMRAETSRAIAETSRAIIGLSAIGGLLAESDRQLTQRMAQLTGRMTEVASAQKDLATAQKDTEANLSVLIQVVERHLREQHGDDRPS